MGRVVVIGAGVSGLTCAIELQKIGHEVTIVGKHIPGDKDLLYASPMAGANWMSFCEDDDKWGQDVDTVAYKKFLEIADQIPEAGVARRTLRIYATDKADAESHVNSWYKNVTEDFKVLTDLPAGCVAGFSITTVSINTAHYLPYLLGEFRKNGGRLYRKTVKHVNDAFKLHHSGAKADLVINCSGLLARFLSGVEDKKVYPIRGQILQISNNLPYQCVVHTPDPSRPFEEFYIFPRPEGGCIMGGCFLDNDWTGVLDNELAERIKTWALKYVPELIDPKYGNPLELDVFHSYVGLRPGREGGVRVEREGNIIHNYGIGGAGYQASYGLAEIVVNLANEYFSRSKL